MRSHATRLQDVRSVQGVEGQTCCVHVYLPSGAMSVQAPWHPGGPPWVWAGDAGTATCTCCGCEAADCILCQRHGIPQRPFALLQCIA